MARNLDDAFTELRKLNEPVPRPRSLPSESGVASLEQRAGVTFQAHLRRYLLEVSDVVFGVLEPITVGGGHTDFEEVLRSARQQGVSDELTPLCEDNGDYYCVTPSGEVVFWSHNGPTDETWPDLATWISDVWIAGN